MSFLCLSLISPAGNSSSAANIIAGLDFVTAAALHVTCCLAPVGGCVFPSTHLHDKLQHAKSIVAILSRTHM